MKRRWIRLLRWTGWSLVVIVAALTGYRYLAQPNQIALQQEATVLEPSDRDCRVDQSRCSAQGEPLDVTLYFSEGAPVMKPFPIRAEIETHQSIRPDTVSVDFQMVGMDMGQNEYRLESEKEGSWTGVAILPVCTTGRRDWQAVVEIRTDAGRRIQATFPFQVGPMGN